MTTAATGPRVVNIIQARMGSSRFPGKMMALLHGTPMIDWVMARSLRSETVHETVLATSTRAIDDVLAERVAANFDCTIFRGSESDVLSRYAEAANEARADVVVRVCADRPLVDPTLIDAAVRDYLAAPEADVVFNHISRDGQNWPWGFGVEVVSAAAIVDLHDHVDDPYHREHVTSHLWHTPTAVLRAVPCPYSLDPDIRFDVDTPDDLARLERIDSLHPGASLEDVLHLTGDIEVP